MSVDAQKLHDVCTNIHELWVSPISIVIATYLLWQVIGPSCLTGLAILLIVAPINGGALARLFIKYQVGLSYKDSRNKVEEKDTKQKSKYGHKCSLSPEVRI